jgi:hypothetical protein
MRKMDKIIRWPKCFLVDNYTHQYMLFMVEGIFFWCSNFGGTLMNTSILAAAVAGLLMAGQNATPTWQKDYRQAQQQVAAQKKPLVVVFGAGPQGWSKVVSEASPSVEAKQLMSNDYVCVYVDTASPSGKELAQQFGITGNVGLVISDRSGANQAFWHQGDLSNQSLVRYLQKFAAPQMTLQATETVNSVQTSFYPPSSNSGYGYGIQNATNPYSSSYCPSCGGGGGGRGRR